MVLSDSCDIMDCSPPGSSVHGIYQAIILEWVAVSFSRQSSWPRDRTQVSSDCSQSPVLQADSLLTEPPGKPQVRDYQIKIKVVARSKKEPIREEMKNS